MTPSLIDRILARLTGVKKTTTGWTALCPSHEDHAPSLSIGEGDDGRVLLKCWSGCSTADVVAAMGLTWRDLFPSGASRGR